MVATKKILGAWLMPLPFAISVLFLALLLRSLGYRRCGRAAAWSALAIAVLATSSLGGNALLGPLEARYPPVLSTSTLAAQPRYIAVLGSGYRRRDDLPITSTLEPTAVVRVVEGVRLWRQLSEAVLVLSGGGDERYAPAAVGYRRAAMELGVPPRATVLIDDALDTATEIRRLRQLVGDESVLLVTSAAHMRRAMAHCERFGVHAIPAPTAHQSEPLSSSGPLGWWQLSGVHLRKTESALHEYLGLLALQLGID